MLDLTNILKKSDLEKIPSNCIASINESINKELTIHETGLKTKFENMFNELNQRFNTYVNQVVTESVNTSLGDKVNKKMLEALTKMASIMESVGIPITEKTIEVTEKLKDANAKLNQAWGEVEEARKQLDVVNKEKYIMERLQGLRPEIIASAIEHFSNKDIVEIKDEIEDFIENNIGNILPSSSDDFTDGLANLDIDSVKDALDQMDVNSKQSNIAKQNLTGSSRFENAVFEKLSKGVSKIKAKGPDTTSDALELAEQTIVESLGDDVSLKNDVEDDTKDALDKISDFNNLGYGYNLRRNKEI